MISLDDKSIFEQYYQANYDFNTSSLSEKDIDSIKTLVKEKRVNYALAPIGQNIFAFISEQFPNIKFELVELDSDTIDGMLYIPKSGDDKAYIIINKNKPFINQIFAVAHEYYHYINDYAAIREKPYICCLSSLKDINEKKASRFATEILLPEDALKKELKVFKNKCNCHENKQLSFVEYAYLSMELTLKYQIPLKAVIYRFHEEGYIGNINKFIENYNVIKHVLLQIEIFKEQVDLLYSTENNAVFNSRLIYQQIEMAYADGLASRDEIIKDADALNLNKEIINAFFDQFEEQDSEEDDSEVLATINKKS
jgi:Zn-dependent peptidase ImmA (M78 family)